MQPSSEIENIIRDWFDCVAKGDASWLERHLSQDARLRIVGTDPSEWLQGTAAADLLRSDLANIGGNVTFDVHEAEGFTEGSVGWGVASFSLEIPGVGKISPRWTGVFHQEDGAWKAVHVHASVGVGNEQVFGTTFTN